MAKLLVIGGSGFFGTSILDSYARGDLQRYGIDSVAIVARHASDLRGHPLVRRVEGLQLFDSDVRTLSTLLESDVVIHAASSSDARRYREDPVGERSIIVDGTARVLELAGRSERPVRLIYVSSGAVYGPQPAAVVKLSEDTPFAEEPDTARRAYTEAKRTAEALVRSVASDKTVGCAIARCFAFVGPALPLDRHFAIGNFLGDAFMGSPITVTSTTRVVRSYMYADDLVGWLLAIAGSCSYKCPVYNVGSDEPVCLRDLAAMIGRVAGVPVVLPDLDPSGSVHRYVPCTDRVCGDLGVTMEFPLHNAIVETIRRRRQSSYTTSPDDSRNERFMDVRREYPIRH